MDPEQLRAELRQAAAALPTGSEDPRRAVARRVHRRRLVESLAVMAAVITIAVGFALVTRPTAVEENRVEFADPPLYPADSEWPTTLSPDPTPSGTVAAQCTRTVPPVEGSGELVVIYLPCVSGDTVGRVYRWLADPTPLEIVRAVMDGPLVDEQRAGRVALFDGPASGLVTDVELDGDLARITMNDNVEGLSTALRDAPGLVSAVQATMFTAFDQIDRIEFGMEATSSDFCATTGLPGGCAIVDRAQWAARPSGWRPSSPIPAGSIGTFGGTRPTGPLQVSDVTVTAAGHTGSAVTAADVDDGSQRWTQLLDGATSFVADQALDDAVLAAPQFGAVTAIDAATGEVRWTFDLPSSQSPGAPAVADDLVYVPASFTTDGDDRPPTVSAVDAATGRQRWQTRLRAETDLQWAPPTVFGDLVIVADTPSGQEGTSRLHALDRENGDVEWTFTFDSRGQAFHDHQPLLHEGRLLATMHGILYALDPATGLAQWRADGGMGPVGVVPGGVVVELERGLTTLDITTGGVRG